jgi:16S rRNA (guanine(966)-N(2))-methyltransferase RsmD
MRPTSSRIREALFNLIGPDIKGSRFLDLCAGSGSVGIEALSRGASCSFFVDNHPTAISLVKRNLDDLGLTSSAVVVRRDAVDSLEHLARRGEVFDLVFLDPPYDSDLAARCLRSRKWLDIMSPFAKMFVEHRSGTAWPHLPGWKVMDSRNYGDTALTVFQGELQE